MPRLAPLGCMLAAAALAASTPRLADAPKPVVSDKIKDRFVPAPLDRQRIEGLLGLRMRVNLEGRLLHVDEAALLGGFEKRPGSQPWIGEHIGKFLDAASRTWAYTGDERLKTLLDRTAHNLIAMQLPDGYLGTYTADQRWTSWDVWVHKYCLLGLLAYYQVTGDAPALETARNVADLLVKTFGDGPGQRDILRSGTHMGMAATSVLEPMCVLYRYTGEQRYLDFARYLVRSWDRPNGPRIIRSLAQTGSVAQTANGKAYEMMSNLVGLVELYRLTGEPSFLKAAQTAWKDIATKRLYITGTTSASEHFRGDGDLPGEQASNVGEGCATVTWLQLTWQLLRITGEPQYADQLERTVYNQLLGAQDPQSGNICYFTPLVGHKWPGAAISCCLSSEPRGISMIPELAWGLHENGIAVLFYTPGEVTIPVRSGYEVTVVSKTEFPREGVVTLTLRA
ncbi:MAG TPA: beta-L-arabinofuranosidase domain-containing protein, partial [Bryobacteraceae bacterium]